MEIKTIFSGPCDNNTYLVMDNDKAVLIDAACSVEQINKCLGERKLVAVFLTHGHYDHVANLDEIVEKFKVKVYATKECFDKLNNTETNCCNVFGLFYKTRLTGFDFSFVKNDDCLDFIDDVKFLIVGYGMSCFSQSINRLIGSNTCAVIVKVCNTEVIVKSFLNLSECIFFLFKYQLLDGVQ